MIRFFFVLFFLISSSCHAEWIDHWCQGIEHCSEGDFAGAAEEFSLAINEENRPDIYVDRGHAYIKLEKYEKALADFNQAQGTLLSSQDLLRAVEGRVMVFAHLGRDEEWATEVDRYQKLSQKCPRVEFFADRIILKNVPDNDRFHTFVSAYLIASKMIKSEQSIRKYPSRIWMIQLDPQVQRRNEEAVINCRRWCDRIAESSRIWCQVFATTQCFDACLFVVEVLRNNCAACCTQGNPFTFCVLPFEDIVQAMIDRGFNCVPDLD